MRNDLYCRLQNFNDVLVTVSGKTSLPLQIDLKLNFLTGIPL